MDPGWINKKIHDRKLMNRKNLIQSPALNSPLKKVLEYALDKDEKYVSAFTVIERYNVSADVISQHKA